MGRSWESPVELAEDRDLWAQQEGETGEQFGAFRAYLKLPFRCSPDGELKPRRIDDMLDEGLVKWSRRHLVKVAKRFSWEVRARAFDDDVDQGLSGKLQQHRLLILENRLSIIASGQEVLRKALGGMAERAEDWRPRDAAVLLEVLSRLEDGLLGMTRGGGPGQVGSVAGAQAVVVNQPGGVLDSHLVEVAEEMQRRLESRQESVSGDVVEGEVES